MALRSTGWCSVHGTTPARDHSFVCGRPSASPTEACSWRGGVLVCATAPADGAPRGSAPRFGGEVGRTRSPPFRVRLLVVFP